MSKLTEREKTYLRNFKNLVKVKTNETRIFIYEPIASWDISFNLLRTSFNGLERNKEYTREELGL